ncbi:3-hydroxyisobutyryl-CoA hydrolase [Microbacterium soli]|uniref:3-hydroxyisobutyryl-CoA hydrolase n=1 Tax=Microbacterium soli TaxID=446075 RepID=A0ABP7MXJ3_9MICO
MNPPSEPEIITEQRGHLGLITLNRPGKLNALTHEMVKGITAALNRWADCDAVQTVAITGAGDRGLCAGGNVVSLHHDVTVGDGLTAAAFWRDEYVMNARIAAYPKPFVALQDGIVLGGGMGVSAHGSHRIVTERSKLGFPETTIGYIPDVGAAWLLSRAPGELGTRVALSGETVGAADAIFLGYSDAFIPSHRLSALLAGLETDEPGHLIDEFSEDPGEGLMAAQQEWTDHAFSATRIVDVLQRLHDSGEAEALALAELITSKSPLALAVTLEAVHRAASLRSLDAVLIQDYRVSRRSSGTHDFAEGIRAQLIDKDRKPHWSPAAHEEVTRETVQEFFEPPAEGDLVLPPSFQIGMNLHFIHITEDLDEVSAWYQDVFGGHATWAASPEFPYLEVEARNADLIVIGNTIVEPMAPAKQVDGWADKPVGRFLKKFGSRWQTMSWYVDDVQGVYRRIADSGVRFFMLGGEHGDDGLGDNNCFFTHPKDTFGGLEFASYASENPRRGYAGDPRFLPHFDQSRWATHHPLGIERLAYQTVVVDDLDRAVQFYVEVLGGEVVFESRSDLTGTRNKMIRLGTDSIVEIAEPFDPTSLAGKDLARNGVFFHALTWKVTDLDKAAAHLTSKGVRILDGDDELLIADPATTHGAVHRFTSFDVPGDPRDASRPTT